MGARFTPDILSRGQQRAWSSAREQLINPDPDYSRNGWCGRNKLVARMMEASGESAQSCLNVLNEAARKGAIDRIMVDPSRPSKGVQAFRWPRLDDDRIS